MPSWNPFKSSQQKNSVIPNQTTSPLVSLNNIPEPTYEIYHPYSRVNESLKVIMLYGTSTSTPTSLYDSKTIVDELDIKLLKSSDESIDPATNKKIKKLLEATDYPGLKKFTENHPEVETVYFVIDTHTDVFTKTNVTLSDTKVYFNTDLQYKDGKKLEVPVKKYPGKDIVAYILTVQAPKGGSMKTSWSKRSDRKRSDRKRSDRKRSDRKRRKSRRQTKSKRSNKTRK
jgi:hypothetical protein